MEGLKEEKNLQYNNSEEMADLLKDSYDIDEESFQDSEGEVSNSKITLHISSTSAQMENENTFLDFIQAIKDDNWQSVKEFLEEEASNRKCK
jgi:hypothetical protein